MILKNRTYLITGIADEHSLAMYAAKAIISEGGKVICTGLGVSPFHENLSERAKAYLNKTFDDFSESIKIHLGNKASTEILDVTLDENIEFFANGLLKKNINIDGILHAVAMDKTIRNKKVKPLLEVTLNEFCETLDVSAFSLIRLTNILFKSGVLNPGTSICALSYIAAEKVTFHPYRKMSIAKAALERIVIELADEMGRHNGTRVNAIRFSTYLGSKAGAATLTEKDVSTSDRISPLGNATPSDLANEVVHLLRPGSRITGEIRHVDGGYHIMG